MDVLATKSDALTTYRVAVECKAWQSPIEKDVVAKLHYIVGDLALSKGIIVSLGGCRSGAERTAADVGIDLWGTEELRQHLGDSTVGSMSSATGPAPSQGWGYGFRISPRAAQDLMRTASRGRMNIRQLEQVVWFSPVWLPGYCIGLTASQPVAKRRKVQVTATRLTNIYEGLSGTLVGPAQGQFELVAIDPALALASQVRDTKVHTAIRKALDGYLGVTSAAARERHAQRVAAAGLPLPCQAVTIDETAVVHLPFYAGVLSSGGQQRVMAVSGSAGNEWPAVSTLLTHHISLVRTHFSPK